MYRCEILVVEDEGIVAMDIQATLERLGYSISGTVASGEEAVNMARYNHPDLVLMDIVFKGSIDGIEAARHIREELDIPVIYLTANADEETVERAKLTEPLGYILKPFEERELHTVVEMALHKHRLEQQLQEWQPSHRKTRSKQSVSHPTSGGSILLVEDNDAHAHLIQCFLEEQPLVDRIDRARDGEEALAYLFRRGPYEADHGMIGSINRSHFSSISNPSASPRPALVLLDLCLPKLGGLEVLQQIKASRELKEIPVVMLSSSEAEADVAAAYALHANGYLIKPLGAVPFAGMIEVLVTYWLGWNHPPQRRLPLGVAASSPRGS